MHASAAFHHKPVCGYDDERQKKEEERRQASHFYTYRYYDTGL